MRSARRTAAGVRWCLRTANAMPGACDQGVTVFWHAVWATTSLARPGAGARCRNGVPSTDPSWGKGQTPIKEVLQLLKKEKWPIYADIELEYQIPPGSDAVKEVAKCVQYCKEALA